MFLIYSAGCFIGIMMTLLWEAKRQRQLFHQQKRLIRALRQVVSNSGSTRSVRA
jgi:hypothetical protein